jgi:hypothetical protein
MLLKALTTTPPIAMTSLGKGDTSIGKGSSQIVIIG